MTEKDRTTSNGFSNVVAAEGEQWPGITSRFLLVVVAGLRNKQLVCGSPSRIEANSRRRRNTSVALEEAKRGLVPFALNAVGQARNRNGSDDSHSFTEDERLETVSGS
jgi:DNA-directed RNA polymerase subunit K/omega